MKCKAKNRNGHFPWISGLLLPFVICLFAGCAASKSANQPVDAGLDDQPPIQSILGLEVVDSPDGQRVLIQGDQTLTYTSAKQPFPPTVILYFPETRLDMDGVPADYQAEGQGDIIRSVKAQEVRNDDDQRTTKIEIALNEDRPYEIIREDNSVSISFSHSDSSLSEKGEAGPSSTPTRTRSKQTATQLHSVYATKLEDSMKVFVGADGVITNYKAFTIQSPPRIIFDIFNLQSPYKNEKKVTVNSPWVETVRYFGYPDRLRLVLETQERFLSAFSAYPIDNGLLIHVGADVTYAGGSPAPESGAAMREAAMAAPRAQDTANRLQSIYATQLPDSTLVTLRGDGQIADYKVVTTENPPAIVLDIYNIENPYEQQNAFPVDTQWVKTVRHETYPNKVRVYIETRPEYLSRFTAYPEKNGMVVYVGKGTSQAPQAPQTQPQAQMVADSQRPQPDKRADTIDRPEGEVPTYAKSPEPLPPSPAVSRGGKPAWVNRIDFLSEEAGKSSLIVGTSEPVRHDVITAGNRELKLQLFNTKTPDYRQRPLITDRFESAVDRIMPRQESENGTAVSVVDIQLRESVPYYVEQTDGLLMVHFEASSIPPTPADTTPATPMLTDAQNEVATAGSKPPASFDEIPSGDQAPSDFSAGPVAVEGPAQPPADMGQPQETAGRYAMESPSPPVPEAPEAGFMDGLSPEAELIDTGPQYTGEPIALDFYETDIKNVFRILREVSGKNFAVDNDVTGKVTLTLEHPVPWDQVLDLVLKMNQLGKTMEGNIIRIATQSTLKREEQQRQERLAAQQSAMDQEKALKPLITEYIPVSYSDAASEIQPHLEKIITKERGSLSVDKRTNMIILTDTADTIKQAREIVEKLDRVTPQVLIEARIVEATTNFSREIGTSWGMSTGISDTTVASGAEAEPGIGPQRGYNMLGGTYGTDVAVNLPASARFGTIGFNFLRIAGTPFVLNAMLMAMETRGEGKIISAPRILTLDNKAANISQGFEYPYQTTDENGETTTEFKDVDLKLDVTPHITPDNRISMKVTLQNNDIFRDTDDGPALSTNEASTELLVNDGDTFVIGGIIRENENTSNDGLPGLSKIPLLGWLFKSRTQTRQKRELLIFITPRIVQLEQRQLQL